MEMDRVTWNEKVNNVYCKNLVQVKATLRKVQDIQYFYLEH